MFNNIGSKIQTFSKVLFCMVWVLLVISFVTEVGGLWTTSMAVPGWQGAANFSWETFLPGFFLLFIRYVVFVFGTYLGALVLCGFGQYLSSVQNSERGIYELQKDVKDIKEMYTDVNYED